MLEDPRNHWTDDKANVVWNDICCPEDKLEFLFDRDKENNDQSDFEASSDFENEADDDIDSGTDLYSEVLLLRNSLFLQQGLDVYCFESIVQLFSPLSCSENKTWVS